MLDDLRRANTRTGVGFSIRRLRRSALLASFSWRARLSSLSFFRRSAARRASSSSSGLCRPPLVVPPPLLLLLLLLLLFMLLPSAVAMVSVWINSRMPRSSAGSSSLASRRLSIIAASSGLIGELTKDDAPACADTPPPGFGGEVDRVSSESFFVGEGRSSPTLPMLARRRRCKSGTVAGAAGLGGVGRASDGDTETLAGDDAP